MIEGRARLLGDNVSGDQIIGGQYQKAGRKRVPETAP